jgi:hypothetical protein
MGGGRRSKESGDLMKERNQKRGKVAEEQNGEI